ncbi:TIR domain-containing protein [Zoogloeaceae bacterium G21618-S1]|nr:TIR domain-containing protein [Zoogloeaceae bacterium G21618-S1]
MRAASVDGIFISYRRDDSAGYAGRLYDRLAGHFGPGRVFMDVEGIEPGTDFVDAIENAVASCRVLIVLIGDEWLSTTDASGRRRLDDPHDFIRLETRAALARDIRVVPVLLDRAPMPAYEALPEDLRPLVRRQAVELNHKQWEATSGELIRTLEKILDASDAPTPAPSPEPEPAAAPPIVPAAAAAPTSTTRHWGLWGALATLIITAAGAWFWLNRDTPQAPPVTLPPAAETPAPKAHLIAEHKAAQFEATRLGDTATLELKLRNTGQAPAALKSTLTDNAHGSFRIIVDTCGDSLRAGGGCSYTLAFSPVEAGKYAAALHVSQLEGEPLQWQLSGEAEAAAPPAPLPTPVVKPTPTPPPAPKPAPAAPRILSLDARAETDGATICYRVENSTQLTLTPRPGTLPATARNCVKVPLSAPATLTLTATGPGGSTRQNVLASPQKPPAPVASGHPQPGETWIYRTRGKWPTSPARTLQFTTDRVDGSTVYENMSVLAPKPARAVLRRSPGTQATMVDWGDIGWEFSPWMAAFDPPTNSGRWRGISTPTLEGRWGDWNTVANVDGRERVRVPAGNFDTVRIEVWSTRLATGGSAMRDVEPTTVHFDVWYAPEAKRYVKMVRSIKAPSNVEIEKDVFELTEIRRP